MNIIRNSIAAKILLLLIVVTFLAVGIVGIVSYSLGTEVLEKESFDKLTAVREMKADQIEDYFENIQNQIITLSQSSMTIDAMRSFNEAFQKLPSEKRLTQNELKIKIEQNRDYFQDEFLPRLANVMDENKYFPLSAKTLNESKKIWLNIMDMDSISDESGLNFIELPKLEANKIKDEINIEGSSSVYGLMEEMTEKLYSEGSSAKISIVKSGTSEGFEKFISSDDIDIVMASRPIRNEEVSKAKNAGKDIIEFKIANDALIVVKSSKNKFLESLDIDQLAKVFSTAKTWNEINPDWPEEDIVRLIPSLNSGSFYLFKEKVLDPFNVTIDSSPNAYIIESGPQVNKILSDNPYAIGLFSRLYLSENRDSLQTIKVDGFYPLAQNIQNNNYPLYKSLYIYSDKSILQNKPQVANFINYLLSSLTEKYGTFIDETAYWESDLPTLILQNLFVATNKYEVGSKDLMITTDESISFGGIHKKYHPIFRDYLKKFKYYDIFLVDKETGHIVYSVFKEIDFGTNLLDGPFSQTSIAKAFKASRFEEDTQFTKLIDFESYLPSYNAPAGFISTPVIDNGESIGVLIFQMPIDVINEIMTNKYDWEHVGLGKSGETYIVGDDYLLRNQSRFLIEDRDNYFKMLDEINMPSEIINNINRFNTTIGLQPVRTKGVEFALLGNSNTEIFSDYRGVPVLSSYKPLRIDDVNWVIMSEMDEEEAFAAVQILKEKLTLWIVVILLIIIFSGVLFSRSITRPLKKLAADAAEISTGNLDLDISVNCKDEICHLAKNFNSMRVSIKDLVNDLEEANLTLEEKVIDRTKGLQQATERIQSILDNAPFAMITIDEMKEIVVFNPAAEKTFGYKADEVIGKHLNILIPESSREIHDSLIEQFHTEETSSRPLDARRPLGGRRKDGTIFPIEAGISKLRLSSKMFYTAFAIDITERQEAEKKILEQKELLENTIESLSHPFYVIDANNYSIKISNSAAKNLGDSGLSTCYALTHKRSEPCSSKDDPCPLEIVKKTKKPAIVEHTHYDKEGNEFYAEVYGYPIFDDKGNVEQMIEYSLDITERKKLEHELERANERMASELNVGREIQMSMIPLIFPAFPNKENVDVYATLLPAREVGGDFYDFYYIDEDHFAFVIGDVSDKGVPAALFMAVSKTLIKSRASEDYSPASILTYVNNEMCRDNTTNMFVTVFLGILNVKTGEMKFTNAGHNPPYLKKIDGSVNELESGHGLVVGAFGGINYKEAKIFVDEGDLLSMYTDGVTEAMNSQNEQFSEKKLIKFLEDRNFESTKNMVEQIYDEIQLFAGDAEQYDDITIFSLTLIKKNDSLESNHMNITLANELPSIAKVINTFKKFGEEHNLEPKLVNKVNIVFDELLNNTISYAFQDDEKHQIDVDISLDNEKLVIRIIDDGTPFNPFGSETPDTNAPLEDRPIGGLGIHLVKNLMDHYEYDRKVSRNVVILTKLLK